MRSSRANSGQSGEAEAAHAQVVRKAGVVSLAVFLSRVTGLVREVTFAALFGAGMVYDAFVASYRMQNLLRDLLAEGALSAAFVTTYSQALSKDGAGRAYQISNRLTTLLVPVMAILSILGIAFAEPLVRWIFPGYAQIEGKLELTVLLTRILAPFLLFIALAAKAMGVLNSHGVFGIPALSSTFFNLTSVGAGLLLGFSAGPWLGIPPIAGMALGTLLGGVVQYACQIPSLRKTGLRFRTDFAPRDRLVLQILRLMGPAAIGAAAVQVNVMVNSVFASRVSDATGVIINGPVSWLGYAFRFMQLPLGLFGVAVGSATLPIISREAGAGRIDEFRETLARSLGLVFLLTIPSSVGLFVLSRPLVGVVYERGVFSAHDTDQTALALAFYCLGLVGYASTKVLAPAFYALDQVRVPMAVALVSIAVNYGLNHVFIDRLGLGHWALALSTSAVATLNFVLLVAFMRAMIGGIHGRRLALGGIKISVASAVMGCCCWLAAGSAEAWVGAGSFLGRAAALAVSVPLGVALVWGLCSAMRVPELALAQRALLKRAALRKG